MNTLRLIGKTRLLVLPATLLLALAACDSSASGRGRTQNAAAGSHAAASHNTVVAQNEPGADDDQDADEQQAAAHNCGAAPKLDTPTPTFVVSPGGSGPGHYGSLACALQVAISYSRPAVQQVTVLVAPGTYSGEKIKLALQPNMPAIVVRPQSNQRPVFQNNGSGAWLRVTGAIGARTPFAITGVEVRDYKTAITLNAQRTPGAPWIGGFTVTNSRFQNIGQFTPDQNFSTAAIRFVNSSYNDFENNTFSNIRNLSRCANLHVFYMAHYSSHNVVRNNTFDNGCGVPIKARDQSDENQIIGNTFSAQEGKSLFVDTFCNSSKKDCTAGHTECPSQNNVFTGNTYLVSPGETPPPAVFIHYPRTVPGCEFESAAPAARVQESGTQFVPRG